MTYLGDLSQITPELQLTSDKHNPDYVPIARVLGAIPSIIESNQDEAYEDQLIDILTYFRKQKIRTPYWMMKEMFRILEGTFDLKYGKSLARSLYQIQHVRIVNELEVNNREIEPAAMSPKHLIYFPSNPEQCNDPDMNKCTWNHKLTFYNSSWYGINTCLLYTSPSPRDSR